MFYHTYETICTGIPSVVWQQQKKSAYIEWYSTMHLNKKEIPTHHITAKRNTPTVFRLLLEVSEWEPLFIEPHHQRKLYWKNDLLVQKKLEDNHNFNKPPEQIENDDINTVSQISGNSRCPSINIWTVNPQLPNTSAKPNFRPPINFTKSQKPVIDTEAVP